MPRTKKPVAATESTVPENTVTESTVVESTVPENLPTENTVTENTVAESTVPENPDITVVIPLYNKENYILQALESVKEQKDCKWELIIVLDQPTDNTESVVLDFQTKHNNLNVTLIKNEENLGMCQSLHKGILEAKGRYVAILDGDDYLTPGALSSTVEFMDNDPEIDMSWSLYEAIDSDGGNQRVGNRCKAPNPNSMKQIIMQNLVHFSCFHLQTVRKSSYLGKMERFDRIKLASAIDYEFVLKNMFNCVFKRLDRVNYVYRYNTPGSVSSERNLQAINSKNVRDLAFAKAINGGYLTGEDVLWVNQQSRLFSSRKSKSL